MADIVDKVTRSRMMAGIRRRDTKPEIQLRRALHKLGLRFTLHSPNLPGRPDIVLPKYHAVIFVNGCFWHRHAGCRFATVPKTRPEFWQTKFAANILRDKRNVADLEDKGWKVAVVWECQLTSKGSAGIAQNIMDWLKDNSNVLRFSD